MAYPAPVPRIADPVDVTISDGTSISSAVPLYGRTLLGIYIPASWTTAAITLQMCPTEGGTFVDVIDISGSELSLAAASLSYVAVDPAETWGMNFIKVRSGTSGTPVNQSGDITLQLMLGNLGR